MKPLLSILAFSVCHLLPAVERPSKPVEFPPTYTKADKTSELVFTIATAKEIEILTLDPTRIYENKENTVPASTSIFHGFPILGTRRVSDPKQIQRLAESLGKAIDAGKSSAFCFSPRHALRIKKPDRSTWSSASNAVPSKSTVSPASAIPPSPRQSLSKNGNPSLPLSSP